MSMRANLYNADNRAFMSSIVNPEVMDDRVRQSTSVAIGREVMRKITSKDVWPIHPLVSVVDVDLGKHPVKEDKDEEDDGLVFLKSAHYAGIELPAGFEGGESEHKKLISMWSSRTSLYKKLPLGMRSFISLVKIDSVRLQAQSFGEISADTTVMASNRAGIAPPCPDEDMITFVKNMSLLTRALGIDRDLAEREFILPAKLLPAPVPALG